MPIWKTKWGWRADLKHKGQRIMAKGPFKYKDDARQWVKDEKERLKSQTSLSLTDEDFLLWTLCQKYLADCKINYGQKTLDEKTYCLNRLYKAVGDIPVNSITPPMILDFINKRAKSKSNNAANKDRKNIKAFYSWVQEMYGVMYDPTSPVKKKPHTKATRRLIPIADILKVLMSTKEQDRVLFGSYWHTGARKGEILRWTWAEDINFEQRWVRLGTRKSRTREMTYEKLWMNDDLHSLLMWQWKHRHPTSPYVFCHMSQKSKFCGKPFTDNRKKLKNLCTNAKVEPFGLHDIRHTVANYLNDLQKVHLKKVQQVLRHRRQSTTEIYVEGFRGNTKEALMLLELKNVEKFK